MAPNSASQSVWHKITSWFDQNADKYLYVPIPYTRTDKKVASTPIAADQGYFRLGLNEMFLKKSVAWGIERFPVIHAEVQMRSGNQPGITLSHIVQPATENGKGIYLNYWLTDLLPYQGGIIEMKASLLALQGDDYLKVATKILQEFSGLLQAPVGQTLGIASKLAMGTRDLLSAAQGDVHLGIHQTFVSAGGGNPGITPGYIAAIRATVPDIEVDRLSIRNDQLYFTPKGASQLTPLQGYDYLLFHLQGLIERDDWRSLRYIMEPFEKAVDAWVTEDLPSATTYKRAALAAAWKSPDLTPADRNRAVKALKSQWTEMESEGRGAVGQTVPDLNTIIATRAISTPLAKALGELSSAEVFDE